ncbi:unnamed protein product [Closterium sp. NIES-64]|nr:unnamed protein product [Closterium sp. NIES-64]
MKGLFGLVRGELAAAKDVLASLRGELVAVREELTRQKERVLMLERGSLAAENEVNALRRALGAVGERSAATAAVVEKRGRELAAVKGELIEVKAELSGLTLRDEMAAGGFTKKYALVKAEDSALTRQKRLMAAVSEYAAAQHDGFEHVIRILDEIGARIGFTSLRDGLVVRSAKVCPETFADLRMSKPACEKAIVALELARAGLEDEAWGQQQYPNSWSSWVKEFEGPRKRPRES